MLEVYIVRLGVQFTHIGRRDQQKNVCFGAIQAVCFAIREAEEGFADLEILMSLRKR